MGLIDLQDTLRGFMQTGCEVEFRSKIIVEGVKKRYARTVLQDGKWAVQEADHPLGPWDYIKPNTRTLPLGAND